MIAVVKIRELPHYRRESILKGLQACGYETPADSSPPKSRRDLLVTWNRQLGDQQKADEWEAKGGTVLVIENGYCGRDADGRQFYAIAVHGHNGSGWFPVEHDDRLTPLGIDLQPWRTAPGYILVCGQRGIGAKTMASPRGWEDRAANQLKAMGFKDVRIRRHPGRFVSPTTIDQDLDGAEMCVIWSSACGVRALERGIPVVFCAPHWICEGAAGRGLGAVESPRRDELARLSAFGRMAHAQWSVEEIASGEPFRRILAKLDEARW